MATKVANASARIEAGQPAPCEPVRTPNHQQSASETSAATTTTTSALPAGEPSKASGSPFRATIVWLILATIYGAVAAICTILPARRRRLARFPRRLCVTGTFHNANWYRSHITPLVHCGLQEVILVVDEPQAAIAGVRFVCPPRWLARVATRAGAKFLWMLWAGLRYRPDAYMGYHILPGAASALVAGRVFRAPAIYQMTGGPIEFDGGGAHSESWLSGCLHRPSPLLERLAVRVVRQFDAVIVRGRRACEYLNERNVGHAAHIITGSVQTSTPPAADDRTYDLTYVGRLSPFKQPEQFVQIVAAICLHRPSVRAAIIGDGPLMSSLRELATKLNVVDAIDWLGQQSDPTPIVAQSRTFVLTSRSEGLSIAMAEAMAGGVVPVVADVGELAQLVHDGENGYLIGPNNISAFAERIESLLSDEHEWQQHSQAAIAAAQTCSLPAVAKKWAACLRSLCEPREQGCSMGEMP